ncbi:hypothetical protein [Mammaliicoccus sciuri]|uniref:hypothetical protein n=1 Tax=Mammaliicoccus sciuri TaxID=1296 RepID=UPI001954982B|nr:hypothetical protein [Mammaliicoccus sciuri]
MEENKTNKNDWKYGCGGCLGIIVILGIVLFLFMGCMADMTEEQKKEDSKQESKREKEQKEIEETNKRLEEKAKKTEEENKKEKTKEEKFAEEEVKKDNQSSDVEKNVKKRVSKQLQSGDVKKVTFYSDSLGSNLTIELLGSENLTDKLTAKAMKYDVLDALYSLKGIDENFDNIMINVKYPLTDSMGKSKNEYVIKSKWDQNIISDMSNSSKYSMVDDMESLSKSYWEHPALNN